MQKTAEAVSLGHPDKISDYISSYILDRMIEQDSSVKYAVEVMIKDNNVILGGEIKGDVSLENVNEYVISALADIGYTKDYAKIWGEYAIEPDKIKVTNLIGQQSADINQGVEQDGWGDQGVFVGYACKGDGLINRELFLARKLNNALYEKAKTSTNLGLDIKTQITLNDGQIETAIVAIPMLNDEDLADLIVETLGEHDFMGFEPVSNMSKGALQLQLFANNILKNALNNSLQQGGDNFIPLPKIQNLVANTFQDKCAFAKAAIKGFRLEQKVIFMDRSKIDAYANWRRSIPTVEL